MFATQLQLRGPYKMQFFSLILQNDIKVKQVGTTLCTVYTRAINEIKSGVDLQQISGPIFLSVHSIIGDSCSPSINAIKWIQAKNILTVLNK